MTTKSDFERYLGGEVLVNVSVLYYMPDFERILNQFFWQTIDRQPYYPRVEHFLAHWKKEIDARIQAVEVQVARGKWGPTLTHVDFEIPIGGD